MGIFDQTTADIQATEKAGILSEIEAAATRFSADVLHAFKRVAQNPRGLTRQQIYDAFGTDGVTLALMFSNTKTYLNAIFPGSIADDPNPPTVNADGSLTDP